MKRLLLLTLSLLLVANLSMADHIGIYSDATGSSCNLEPGFSTTATVIHKFSIGATSSRFKLDLSLSPGSSFFAFTTLFPILGTIVDDGTIQYGECLNGSIVLGMIIAIWVPGVVAIAPADGFTHILYTDCDFVELHAAGGSASIGGSTPWCYNAVEPATWGKVKALYH